jgi:hypothetical protein
MPESSFMETGMHIMTPEPISTAHFMYSYPTHQFVCMFIPLSSLGNGSVKNYRGKVYRSNNSRIVERAFFYVVHLVLKESRRLVFPRTSSFILYWFVHFKIHVKEQEASMKQLASRALLSKVVAFNEIIIFLLFLVG